MKRVITAAVLIPFALWVILRAPEPLFLAVVALFAVLCFYEYTHLSAAHGVEVYKIFGYLAGAIVLWQPAWLRWTAAPLLAMVLTERDLRRAMPRAGFTILGVAYIFGAWACAPELRRVSPYWMLFAIVVNWFGDSAAFYVGRAIGRHKLAPNISPAKSVEGSLASVVAAALFSLAFRHFLLPATSVEGILLLGIAANVAGQAGDLAESALKRGAGVKDSGSTLPGHGGWLDRLDSTLFSLPVVAWLLPLIP